MDAQSVTSNGYDDKENYLQQSDFYSKDTNRINGLKNTSLSVLSSKRNHKTQTQKQFQQFHQSQLNQNRQSQFRPVQQGPYQQQTPQHPQQYAPHPQYFNSMPPPSLRPPGAKSMQSLNSMTSSNYSQSPYNPHHASSQQHIPQMLPQGEWNGGRISPQRSPSLRLNSLSSNQMQFQAPQQEYKNISPVLSQSEWDKPFQDERIKELELENERLLEQNGELAKSSEIKTRETKGDNDRLKSQLDSVSMELNKLKLEYNSVKETHKSELKKLKEKNSELQSNLENISIMNEKSNETTPNASPKTVGKEYETSSVATSTTTTTLPESSKNLQQAQSNLDNNELVQDLLETIKYLKTDNSILRSQKEELKIKMTKDKKLMQKLVNSSRYQIKIRKGFNVLESVDTFI